jgi:hypothetical protein
MRLIHALTAPLSVILAAAALSAPAAAVAAGAQAPRSPDAASAALAQERSYSSSGEPVALRPAPSATQDDGFRWEDAAIGAGAAVVVVLAAAGTVAFASRHRRTGPRPSVAAR